MSPPGLTPSITNSRQQTEDGQEGNEGLRKVGREEEGGEGEWGC